MTETLGQRIAQRRRMLSISQEAFGEKMGVSRQAISKWESDAAIPEVDRLIEMSKLFDVSVGWLLGTEQDSEPPEEPISFTILPPIPDSIPATASSEPTTPENSEKPHHSLAWLSILCAVAAVASLILSILAYTREMPTPEIPTPTAQLSEEDKEYIDTTMEDMDYLQKRCEAILESLIERSAELYSLSNQMAILKAYVYSLPLSSDLIPEMPAYEQFISWNLVGNLDKTKTEANLMFSCQTDPNIGVTAVQLHVIQDDTPVAQYSCIPSDEYTLYSIDFKLKPANGYRYEVQLNYESGKTEQFELTGHGLSDLLDASMPEVQFVPSEESRVHPGGGNFGYDAISLSEPRLFPDYYQWCWVELRLVRYRNDEKVGEFDLTDTIKFMERSNTSLTFSFGNHSFSGKEGEIHEIRLEGNIKITADATGLLTKPIYYEYSVPLETFQIPAESSS